MTAVLECIGVQQLRSICVKPVTIKITKFSALLILL